MQVMIRANTREAIEARRAAWSDRIQAELRRMLALLREHEGIRRVILFGSHARGDARNHSDLDMAIVQRTDKPFPARLDEFYRLLTPRVETDVLVYTPEEWDELRETRHFVKRLEKEGVVLYASGES